MDRNRRLLFDDGDRRVGSLFDQPQGGSKANNSGAHNEDIDVTGGIWAETHNNSIGTRVPDVQCFMRRVRAGSDGQRSAARSRQLRA